MSPETAEPRDAEIERIAAILLAPNIATYWLGYNFPDESRAPGLTQALYDAGLRLDRDRAAVPGLDVERLERAMDSVLSGYIGHSMTDFLARDLAAEYARLSGAAVQAPTVDTARERRIGAFREDVTRLQPQLVRAADRLIEALAVYDALGSLTRAGISPDLLERAMERANDHKVYASTRLYAKQVAIEYDLLLRTEK